MAARLQDYKMGYSHHTSSQCIDKAKSQEQIIIYRDTTGTCVLNSTSTVYSGFLMTWYTPQYYMTCHNFKEIKGKFAINSLPFEIQKIKKTADKGE